MKKISIKVSIISLLIIITCCSHLMAEETINYYNYKIINKYPHDHNAFTQGLLYKNGYLYESTGRYGKSSLKKIKLKSGKVVNKHNLDDKYFGEGICIFNDKIYQLTWKENTAFVYNLDFEIIEKLHYKNEGWGLTHNNKKLIMSDGSSKLYFLNPENLKIKREMTVTKKGKELDNLNELEYIDGKIYANVWQKNYIVIINPDNGKVSGVIDLKGLINVENYEHDINVLNGIAYDSKHKRLFVTGKLWPYIFEIELE